MSLVLEILQTLYKLGWLLGIKETFSKKQLGCTTLTFYWASCTALSVVLIRDVFKVMFSPEHLAIYGA